MRGAPFVKRSDANGLQLRDSSRSALLVVIFALGCGAHADKPRAAKDLASRIATTGSADAIFWFDYVAPPPEGRWLHVAAIEGDRRPCSYFEDGASDEGLSSVVNVALSDATHGEHQVVPRASFESGEQLAYVEWVGNPSARETARAIRGTVEYLDGPSSESEWTEAAHAALRVAVVFEGDPVVEASCSGEQDLRTGEVTEHCDCRRLSGDEFQCSTTTDCCVDGTAEPSEVVDVQFEMRATPCAAACSFTDSSLAPYCRDLDG